MQDDQLYLEHISHQGIRDDCQQFVDHQYVETFRYFFTDCMLKTRQSLM